MVKEVKGYPMVAEYKYLGVLIDDSGKFDVQINRKKAIENKAEV